MADIISGKVNIGWDAIAHWDRNKCARVYRAAWAAVTEKIGEDEARLDREHDDALSARAMRTGNNFGRPAHTVYTSSALQCLQHVFTKVIDVAPSQESREWSNIEGGHRFFDKRTADDILRAVMAA